MPGPDTAVEEAPVLAGFGLALISLLMWIVLCGLKATWVGTFGAIFDELGGIKVGTWPHKVHPFGFLKSFSHGVENTIGEWAAGYEHAMGFWFHQSARLQGWLVDETFKLARDTLHFGDWLLHVHLPKQLRWALTALFPWPAIYRVVRHLISEALPKVSHIAHAAAHTAVTPIYRMVAIPHLGELQWIHRHWKAIRAAVIAAGSIALAPGLAIPRIWHGIDQLRHRLGKLERRVTRTEALFGAAALSVAMANVLGLRSARCLRNGPIGKVSRALCGLSSHALGDLLGLLADVIIVADVCEVITLLNEGLTVIEGPLADLTGVAGAALCHGDYSEPAKMPAVTLYLPPNPALALSGV